MSPSDFDPWAALEEIRFEGYPPPNPANPPNPSLGLGALGALGGGYPSKTEIAQAAPTAPAAAQAPPPDPALVAVADLLRAIHDHERDRRPGPPPGDWWTDGSATLFCRWPGGEVRQYGPARTLALLALPLPPAVRAVLVADLAYRRPTEPTNHHHPQTEKPT
jgi:hypothetical protein